MIKLSVNINKIALLRNSRGEGLPDLLDTARTIVGAGAHGITIHPRSDLRHILPCDVPALSKLVKILKVEFNIEGNPLLPSNSRYPGLLQLVEIARPDQCTLVPDSQTQRTSNQGFDLLKFGEKLHSIILQLKQFTRRISLFLDPTDKAAEENFVVAQNIGADRIELYTAAFANAFQYAAANKTPTAVKKFKNIFSLYQKSAQKICDLGMGLNAGHDLNMQNVVKIRKLVGLQEVSIGHAFVNDALYMGLEPTVAAYLKALKN